MQFSGTEYIAILVAAAASFAFGAVYYTLLAKPWIAAVEKTEQELKQSQSSVPFIIAAISQILMSFVFAALFLWHHDPAELTKGHSALLAVSLWVGFLLTSTAVNNAFRGAKPSLTVIDAGHWLGVLLIQGLVISTIAG